MCAAVIGPFQRQRVDLPSGVRYWSVTDAGFELVSMFDAFLFDERFVRGRSEKTTARYASSLVESPAGRPARAGPARRPRSQAARWRARRPTARPSRAPSPATGEA